MDVTRVWKKAVQKNKLQERDPAGQAGSLPALEVFSCSSTQTT